MTDGINLTLIPNEMLKIIPKFDGDKQVLNLFLRKCEYIINKYKGDAAQNEYVLNAITSRLASRAAAVVSEREVIKTWEQLKEILDLHFGDHRTEEGVIAELESLTLARGESYQDFFNRIHSVRSALISKIEGNREGKTHIYNELALKTFLYNLPEPLMNVVRFKSPKTLEDALKVAEQEASFTEQWSARNGYQPRISNRPRFPSTPQNNNFGIGTPSFGISAAKPQYPPFGSAFGSSQVSGSGLFGGKPVASLNNQNASSDTQK